MPAAPTLRALIARLDRSTPAPGGVIAFGLAEIDRALPGGGLATGALHEFTAPGAEAQSATAPALLAAGLLARRAGPVLWIAPRPDLYPPALAAIGLPPRRLVLAAPRSQAALLATMEDALRQPGLAGVVGELGGKLGLTASRRLQLAAERSGVTAILLRRPRFGSLGVGTAVPEPTAAATRWCVGAAPSAPPLAHAPDTPGLGRARWRVDLQRCRGGEPHSWILEAFDATGGLALVADLADRPAAPPLPIPRVGRAAG